MDSTSPIPGSPPADDHSSFGPPPQEVIKRGYEADYVDTKTVLSVPILVVVFFVLAFATVTGIFSFIAFPPKEGSAHPRAAERNQAPLNDRLGRLGRNAKHGEGQPILEPLRQRSGDARAISRPEIPGVNAPEYHAEDLRPTPETQPALFGGEPGKTSIEKTMTASDEELKKLFPSVGSKLINSQHSPSAANAGRGGGVSTVVSPELPKQEEKKPAPDKGGKP